LSSALRGLFYVLFIIFGGLIGFRVADYYKPDYLFLPRPAQQVNFWALIGVGILLGVVLAPYFAQLFQKLIDKVVLALHNLTLQEIILGGIGLIFGMLLALLTSFPIMALPLNDIPIIGNYLEPLIIIFITIFWSYLGIFFATRTVMAHNFGQFFSEKSTALSWGKSYKILDTSVIIDGRILDICRSGFIEGSLMVPRFVLTEVQQLADSMDSLKRNRGRRGLDILHKLRTEFRVQVMEKDYPDLATDSKLVKLGQEFKGVLLTTDYNLNKVAQVQGLRVLNINELAQSLKPVVLPGEEMDIHLIREGKEANQGVGYLDDGTMVVVENGRKVLGETIRVEVTSVIQTVAGKMIFARPKEV